MILERKKRIKLTKVESYREWLKALVREINDNGQHKGLCIALLKREKCLAILGQLSR